MEKSVKSVFSTKLNEFVKTLNSYVSTADGQWTIKGFIDIYRRIYTISSDTKIVSKLLEIHLFPRLLAFAEENGYTLVPAEKQNYYPDISFVSENEDYKFALDFKTTYRRSENPEFCNGFCSKTCTAPLNSSHSLNQDCGIISTNLKGVSDGETQTQNLHPRV